MHLWRKLLAAIALIVAFVGFGAAAQAAPIGSAYGVLPANNSSICDPTGRFSDELDRGCLPVHRWGEAIGGMHIDLPTGASSIIDLTLNAPQVTIQSWMFSWGSNFWGWTVGISEWSSNLNILSSVGGVIDKAAATLGEALFGSPIVAALVIATLIGVFFSALRGRRGGLKNLARSLVIVALAFVVVQGATNTVANEDGSVGDNGYGRFSPGWIANMLNSSISALSDTVSEGTIWALTTPSDFGASTLTNQGSCAPYVKTLINRYRPAGLVFDEANGTYVALDNTKADSTLPLALNYIWMDTGLTAWAQSQFSTGKVGDEYLASNTYCRLLEWNAGIPARTIASVINTRTGDQGPFIDIADGGYASLAVSPFYTEVSSSSGGVNEDIESSTQGNTSERVTIDTGASLIGWAACQWNGSQWSFREGWGNAVSSGSLSDGSFGTFSTDPGTYCGQWWGTESDGSGKYWDRGDGFAVDHSNSNITRALPDFPQGQAFVRALYGYDKVSTGGAISGAFLLSAIVNFVVFGGLALLVAGIKAVLAFLSVLLVIFLLMSLIPGQMATSLLGRYFKTFLGMSVLAWGYSFLLAIVVLFSSLITRIGSGFTGGYGSTFSIAISAISPLLAVAGLGFLFKKMLHFNPLNPREAVGMMGMGGAIGATGFAMGNRAMNQGKQALKGGAKEMLKGDKSAAKTDTAAGLTPLGRPNAKGARGSMSAHVRNGGGGKGAGGERTASPQKEAAAEAAAGAAGVPENLKSATLGAAKSLGGAFSRESSAARKAGYKLPHVAAAGALAAAGLVASGDSIYGTLERGGERIARSKKRRVLARDERWAAAEMKAGLPRSEWSHRDRAAQQLKFAGRGALAGAGGAGALVGKKALAPAARLAGKGVAKGIKSVPRAAVGQRTLDSWSHAETKRDKAAIAMRGAGVAAKRAAVVGGAGVLLATGAPGLAVVGGAAAVRGVNAARRSVARSDQNAVEARAAAWGNGNGQPAPGEGPGDGSGAPEGDEGGATQDLNDGEPVEQMDEQHTDGEQGGRSSGEKTTVPREKPESVQPALSDEEVFGTQGALFDEHTFEAQQEPLFEVPDSATQQSAIPDGAAPAPTEFVEPVSHVEPEPQQGELFEVPDAAHRDITPDSPAQRPEQVQQAKPAPEPRPQPTGRAPQPTVEPVQASPDFGTEEVQIGQDVGKEGPHE